MVDVILWHNPRCSKSREALRLLTDAGANVSERRYLDDAPTRAEIDALCAALGNPAPIDMMRSKEAEFREMGLSRDSDAEVLLNAMVECPKLIERPVAVVADRAVIGRPPEDVLTLLKSVQ